MTSVGSHEIMTWETDGGQPGPQQAPILEDLINQNPLAVYDFYNDAQLKTAAAQDPELVDRLAMAYVSAKLGEINA
jgi:hypothetical protein